MKLTRIVMVLLGVAVAFGLTARGFAAGPPEPAAQQKLATFYFGNSLTGCSDPSWHGELGKSAGKEWVAEASLGAGWQLWQHRHELQNSGVPLDRGSKGDLTIDAGAVKDAKGKQRKFLIEKWDAIVLQPFSMGLTWKCKEMWGQKFDKETDVGDIASAIDIIDVFLGLNPQGKVFIYQNWPAMNAGKVPADDQLPPWAVKMKERTKQPLRTAEFPDRAAFDYEKEWAVAKHEPSSDPERFWFQKNARSKDYHDKVFAALTEHYPELYKSGRLRVIPVGDIYLSLHRKMKAGEFPGCKDVGDFYTDVQHIRGGLPRYTVAAAFFASLFHEHPEKLDWKLYGSEDRYRAMKQQGDDPFHDRGELFEITPERAKIVNDTIWEAVQSRLDVKAAGSNPK